jgi:hypothetical protein
MKIFWAWVGIGTLLIPIVLFLYATGGTSPPLPQDLLEILQKGKILNVVPEACVVAGRWDLYRAFLDMDNDGVADVGVMGEILKGEEARPPLVWIFYGKEGEPERAILTLPDREVQRMTFEELLKLYPSPCHLIGRQI